MGSHNHTAVFTPNVSGIPEDHDSIWRAVERIRGSTTMSGCNRLVQLLKFVVGSTLKGESIYLKETTIGVAVFGRSPDYDPKVDTIVRSQAWRLRAKLKKYYATEGIEDPIVIDLPLGHYVPVFSVRRRTRNRTHGVIREIFGSRQRDLHPAPYQQLSGPFERFAVQRCQGE